MCQESFSWALLEDWGGGARRESDAPIPSKTTLGVMIVRSVARRFGADLSRLARRGLRN